MAYSIPFFCKYILLTVKCIWNYGYVIIKIYHFIIIIYRCIVGSLPTRDGPLCAVCMLLCVAPSFAVLPGVLMYVSYMGELTV